MGENVETGVCAEVGSVEEAGSENDGGKETDTVSVGEDTTTACTRGAFSLRLSLLPNSGSTGETAMVEP